MGSWTNSVEQQGNKLTFTRAVAAPGSYLFFSTTSFLPPSFLLWPFPLLISSVSFLISYQHLEWFTPAPHLGLTHLSNIPENPLRCMKILLSVCTHAHPLSPLDFPCRNFHRNSDFNSFLGCHTTFSHYTLLSWFSTETSTLRKLLGYTSSNHSV